MSQDAKVLRYYALWIEMNVVSISAAGGRRALFERWRLRAVLSLSDEAKSMRKPFLRYTRMCFVGRS